MNETIHKETKQLQNTLLDEEAAGPSWVAHRLSWSTSLEEVPGTLQEGHSEKYTGLQITLRDQEIREVNETQEWEMEGDSRFYIGWAIVYPSRGWFVQNLNSTKMYNFMIGRHNSIIYVDLKL